MTISYFICISFRSSGEDVKEEVNQRTHEGETALFLAAKAGHHDVVSVLLQNEADPNISNNEDGSPVLQGINCYTNISSSAENQKGVTTVQRCSVKNQKVTVTIDFVQQ